MKIVNLDQAGPDWHRWRSQGLGGSDAPVVMGECKWQDVDGLRRVKAGLEVVAESYPMKRGKALEPPAREAYMARTGIKCRPVCVVNEQYPWLRASLDGLSEDDLVILEVKCPMGYATHKAALDGKYDPKYRAQLQHQFLVTGLARLDFVSFTDSKLFSEADRLVVIPVDPDPDYMVELFKRERVEWERTNPDWKGLH